MGEHAEAVRRSLDSWNRGDVDAWLEPAHPEIEWFSEIARSVEGSETVYRGMEEMRRYWDEWHALWDVTIDVTEIRELGDTAIAIGHVRARGESSGIDLERPIAFVFEFEEGLARRARSYFDVEEALAAASAQKAE